jgi:hypothetical protein
MLKMRADDSVDAEGSPTRKTTFGCGPIRECTKCPCFHFDVAHEWEVCCFYGKTLTREGEYPKNCRVTKIEVTEKF